MESPNSTNYEKFSLSYVNMKPEGAFKALNNANEHMLTKIKWDKEQEQLCTLVLISCRNSSSCGLSIYKNIVDKLPVKKRCIP